MISANPGVWRTRGSAVIDTKPPMAPFKRQCKVRLTKHHFENGSGRPITPPAAAKVSVYEYH